MNMQNTDTKERKKKSLREQAFDSSSNGVHMAHPRPIPTSPTWVTYSSEVHPDLKRALAHYAAFHLIEYGNMLLIGSGTTLNCLMDEIIGRHVQERRAFDLIILT